MYKGLYDIFKHWYRGGGIYLYSDPHFADTQMSALRKDYVGDEGQVKRINSQVGKCDTIIFLGDIGDIEYIKKIRGYKVLITGNHDKGVSNYKREMAKVSTIFWDNGKKYTFTNNVPSDEDNHLFDEVYEGALTISDKVILSHEEIEDLPPFLFNIHGHDHSGRFIDSHHLNVCAECINYTPVRFDELLKNGKLKDIESIHRITIDKATERKKKRNENSY